MWPLAERGFHVFAPDQRGYGRTTGADTRYDCDLEQFGHLNLARDALGLATALGHSKCAIVGHDFGSPIAGWCALAQPGRVIATVFMSAPFEGPKTSEPEVAAPAHLALDDPLFVELARLPHPKKHYVDYYRSREANENLSHPPQGIAAFLRAYYHFKSADWKGNEPEPLPDRSAASMTRMPAYYIMDSNTGMAETVDRYAPSPSEVATNQWLTEDELAHCANEFERTGFQGGLNWYRAAPSGHEQKRPFAGKTIDTPAFFVSGERDWGAYQNPGAIDRMQTDACADFRSLHWMAGAGHWVQQEQAKSTATLLGDLLDFLI